MYKFHFYINDFVLLNLYINFIFQQKKLKLHLKLHIKGYRNLLIQFVYYFYFQEAHNIVVNQNLVHKPDNFLVARRNSTFNADLVGVSSNFSNEQQHQALKIIEDTK